MSTVHPCFSVYHTADDYGRLGKFIGHYMARAHAELAAANTGWYGGIGSIVDGWYLNDIDGKLYLLKEKDPVIIHTDYTPVDAKEAARIKAMSKLDDADRKALGL